jgi:putative sterol carrier protein
MALKYLQLPEPTYIPKYASVDPQVLGQVTSQIENQIQQGRQSLSALDQLEDNTSQALSILPDSYKQQYKEVLNRTRAQLDEDVEKYGYRNIQGKVRNLARDFQSEVAPLMQTAGQVSAAYKRIDDSKAEGVYKSVGRQAIQQALETGTGGVPDVSVFENWRDLYKDVDDLSRGWQGSQQAFEELKNSPYGEYIHRALRETGRADVFKEAATAKLMNNPQAFRQLEIMVQAANLAPTAENIALMAASIVEPNVMKLQYEKQSSIERMEIDSQSFMSSLAPSIELGIKGDPALQSVEGFTESLKGYEQQINLISSRLNDYIINSSFEYPEYKGAVVKWNEDEKEYEIIAKDGKTKINSPTALALSSEREYYNNVQNSRKNELNNATFTATKGKYRTYEEFIKSNPNAVEAIATARRRVEGGKTARRRDPISFLVESVSNLFGADEELTAKDEARVMRIAANISPELKEINEVLKTRFSDKSVSVQPITPNEKTVKQMNSMWSAISGTNAVFDSEYNEVTNDDKDRPQIPNKATYLGHSFTPNGMELLWSAEDIRDSDGKIVSKGGVYRTKPSGNQIAALAGGDNQKNTQIAIYSSLSQLANPQYPKKDITYPIEINGKEYNFNVYYDVSDNVYRMRIPNEIASQTNQYYQTYNNVDEVTLALSALFAKQTK